MWFSTWKERSVIQDVTPPPPPLPRSLGLEMSDPNAYQRPPYKLTSGRDQAKTQGPTVVWGGGGGDVNFRAKRPCKA